MSISLSLNVGKASNEGMVMVLKGEEQEEISTSSNSFQGNENDILPGDKFLETIKEGIKDDALHCFVFNIVQGNFVVLKFNKNIVLIDCGSQNATEDFWKDFYKLNQFTLDTIFKNSSIKAVVVTHPDKDHYNCLKSLFAKTMPAKDCIFVVGRKGENDHNFFTAYLKKNKLKNIVYAVESDNTYNNANKDLTTALFDKVDGIGTVEILEPVYQITEDKANPHSLVLKVIYDKQSILFTGDATKETFEAIYGDAKNEEVKELSIKNRLALKSVNFLIAPHHGANTAESNLWLMHVNAKNPYNFVGAIFCAPRDTQYGHPNKYIDTIAFENETFRHKFKYHYDKEQGHRIKASHEPIWVTGLITHAYWLTLSSEKGMQIFNDSNGKFHTLLTQDGWSLKMQRIYEDLKSNDIPNTTLSILLQNPRKWKCRNGKGQILTEALYADESGNFEGNASNNIQKYRNIISQKENSLHKYYTSTLTNDDLLARYFKFPNNPKQDSTKTLKEEQEELFNRKHEEIKSEDK